VLEQHKQGDIVEGRVTKVVTFGAFVEILPGVEGLVHISELANHHVENPREVVSQGDVVRVLILEVDAERRRLSLSLKRAQTGDATDAEEPIQGTPRLDLSEDVFTDAESAPEAPPLDEAAVDRETPPTDEQTETSTADELH
jgi:small subunit ribosomal protein S1